jgi:hypothetical protein
MKIGRRVEVLVYRKTAEMQTPDWHWTLDKFPEMLWLCVGLKWLEFQLRLSK